MIEKASLIIGNDNFAVKEDKFLGYALNQGYYVPREIDLVRATTATRVNENGLIELVAYNLLTYSEQFNNAAWTKTSGVTITANAIIAPNGTLTADYVQMGAINRVINQITSFTNLVSVTGSIYIKGTSGETIQIASGGADQLFTLNGEWQRLESTKTNINGSFNINTFGGATALNFYIWGAQLVSGTSAKTYFPTTDRLDIARVDYTNGTKSLLVEPQRTNIIPRSEDIDTGWSKLNVTVASNQTTSPSGILNAWKTIATSTNAQHASYDTLNTSVTAGSSYFISCFVKKDTTRYIRLNEGFTGATINFDFDTATILSETSGASNSIVQNFGNGWYRIGFKFTPSTTNTQFALYINNNSNVDAYAGTTESVYLWGCQIELGSNITSYIQTVGSSVTRNADVISKTGISNLIGQTEGTLFVDFNKTKNNLSILSIDDGTANNRIFLEGTGTSTGLRVRITNGGTTTVDNTSNVLQNGINKIALIYANNNVSLYRNGVLIFNDNSATIPNTSILRIGSNVTNLFQLDDSINSAVIWKTALTDQECINLTTI